MNARASGEAYAGISRRRRERRQESVLAPVKAAPGTVCLGSMLIEIRRLRAVRPIAPRLHARL
jgi:hypothetical protein